MTHTDNYYKFLNMSDFVVEDLSKKWFSETPELQKELYKALYITFAEEATKNGVFVELSIFDNVPSYEVFTELTKDIETIFGVTAYCLTEDSDISNINPEKFTNSLLHIPLIIAYKCSFEKVFTLLRNVGEFANIIWIR